MSTRESGTVSKAIMVLNQFLNQPDGMTLTQLAQRTGIHKSTTLRLCTTLENAGFLHRDSAMVYRVGPKIWQLAQIYRLQFRLEGIIRPLLRELRDRTEESASFYILEGDERVCLFRENSRHVIRHHMEEGTRLPLAAGGVVGRVLLALLGEPGAEFDRIRGDGHLVDQGRMPDTASAAVPVLLPDETLLGVVVVSGPQTRFDEPRRRHALELVLQACRSIRERLPVGGSDVGSRMGGACSAALRSARPKQARRAGGDGLVVAGE
jgi:DNA-binding IclR family transcriptional regulator